MPLLPTDICGKLYRNFDVLALPDSLNEQIKRWCEDDLALPPVATKSAEPDRTPLKVVYDSRSDDPEFRAWGLFATDFGFHEHIRVSQVDHVGRILA